MFIKENSKFKLVSANSKDIVKSIDSGVYTLKIENTMFSSTTYIEPIGDIYKKGITINEGIFKKINDDIESLMSKEMNMARKELGMIQKNGIMFNGAPGTGKTFLAGQIGEKFVKEKNAICLIATDTEIPFAQIVDTIRMEDPNRFIMIIIDEFEKSFRSNNTAILSFLDGSDSKENIFLIATVNDTSKLPSFITDRPGRFEKIYTFNIQDESILKPIILNILPKKYKSILTEEINTLINKIKKEKSITIDSIRMHIRDLIYMHLKLTV